MHHRRVCSCIFIRMRINLASPCAVLGALATVLCNVQSYALSTFSRRRACAAVLFATRWSRRRMLRDGPIVHSHHAIHRLRPMRAAPLHFVGIVVSCPLLANCPYWFTPHNTILRIVHIPLPGVSVNGQLCPLNGLHSVISTFSLTSSCIRFAA